MISFETISIKSFILERMEEKYLSSISNYLHHFNHKIFLLDDKKLIYDALILKKFKIEFNGRIVFKSDSFISFGDYLEDLQLFNFDSTVLNVSELINEINNLKRLSNLTIENSSLNIENILLNTHLDTLRVLNLRNNSLKLEPYSFLTHSHHLENLAQLHLGDNLIDIIYDSAFKHMKNLVYLNLEWNKIDSIRKDAFKGLENLIELNLENIN